MTTVQVQKRSLKMTLKLVLELTLMKANIKTIFLENNKYYAVYYDEGWFIGKLLRHIDGTADNPIVEITFLKQNKRKKCEFKWPGKEDLSNVETQYIFFGPIAIKEKESGIFNITEDVLSQINIAYSNKKQK
ncbi:uncharacterized protein LOC123311722 [Coccinella septempunctata]|uniref:uncharacterized protein LOC123311722 n=1 Tax=Coccinella septempunctata TaxID=41139 RepID=UPI001D07D1BA|nr:uncharacterized protein LOC123311722 [Coccinella septempunctata]